MTSRRIVPRILGGLGNQLFIYAAARRLAHVTGAELVLDNISGFRRDSYGRRYELDKFNVCARTATHSERLEPFSRIRRALLRRRSSRLPFPERTYIVQEGLDFDERLLRLRPTGDIWLEGYWQSESYFTDIGDLIRRDFSLKQTPTGKAQRLSEIMRTRPSVAVHVRFFDDPEVQEGNNAPQAYYRRALAHIAGRVEDAHYYVFSDRPREARERIPLPDSCLTIIDGSCSDGSPVHDLWLMAQCDHFIIANSTFSWWGAWLGTSPHKQVVAPGHKVPQGATAWGFKGLLPSGWTQL